MARIPERVIICEWEVPLRHYPPEIDGPDFGDWRFFPSPEIRVNRKLDRFTTAQTILHESIHAISDMHGLELTEAHVRTLEQCVSSWLRNNPSLARTLIKGS